MAPRSYEQDRRSDGRPTGPSRAPGGDAPVERMLALQRLAGNGAVSQAMQQRGGAPAPLPVQRLLSPSQLRDLAGDEHSDIKLGMLTLRKMSVNYKAVLGALGEYHDATRKMRIVSDAGDRRGQATALKDWFLKPVADAAQLYLTEQPQGRRAGAMQKLLTDLQAERVAIDTVASSSAGAQKAGRNGITPEGPPWATLLAPLTGGYARVRGQMEDRSIDSSLFHGTASPVLDKMRGELLSGQKLVERGIKRETGEGDFFSTGGGGEKSVVSVGQGAPGLGTAMAYAKAPLLFKDYNVALYPDGQLAEELTQAKRAVDHWDESLAPAKDGYVAEKKTKGQFEAMVKRLQAEVDARKNLPPDHPRRKGQDFSVAGYPLMFQFNSKGLQVNDPRHISLEDHELGPIALGGERQLQDGVDFSQVMRLEAVWCPYEHVDTVRRRIEGWGLTYAFDVIPIEVAAMLPKAAGNVELRTLPNFEKLASATRWTETATLETMESMYDNSRRMILHAYGEGMETGQAITPQFLTATAKRIGLR